MAMSSGAPWLREDPWQPRLRNEGMALPPAAPSPSREDKPCPLQPWSEQDTGFNQLWVSLALQCFESLELGTQIWVCPPHLCPAMRPVSENVSRASTWPVEGPRDQRCRCQGRPRARFSGGHLLSTLLPSKNVWLSPFYAGTSLVLTPSLTTPSEGHLFTVCDGEDFPVQSCLSSLAWAGWARLGGGEVGQPRSHGDSSCSLPAFSSPHHKPHRGALLSDLQGWGPGEWYWGLERG